MEQKQGEMFRDQATPNSNPPLLTEIAACSLCKLLCNLHARCRVSTPVHALETQLMQVSRCSTQVSFLLKCERYSLADYTRSLKEASDKAGVDGWRKHMPGVKTNEQVMTLLFSFGDGSCCENCCECAQRKLPAAHHDLPVECHRCWSSSGT